MSPRGHAIALRPPRSPARRRLLALGRGVGATAIDASGGNRNASHGGGVAYGRAGALAGDTDPAVGLGDGAIALPTTTTDTPAPIFAAAIRS